MSEEQTSGQAVYSIQHWEEGDGVHSGWATNNGYYMNLRRDAETVLAHNRRVHPDITFRLARAQITDWEEV